MIRFTLLLAFMIGLTGVNAQTKAATNKHFLHSMESQAPPEKVWGIWTDVPNWKTWDAGLKDASMKGEFKLGAKGKIVSLEGRTSKFKVVSLVEGQSYTIKTKLPLGSLYVTRHLKTENGTTHFTHEVWFKGLTAGIFSKAFGPKFREMLPMVLLNVKKQAEANAIP